MLIYCVEDDRNIRELLLYTLQSTGYQAKGMSCKAELFEALEQEVPHLILLDIMLPGEDGYTILKRLKSSPLSRHVPVIMVTAKSSEFDKVKGLEDGADDYITKPFGMMEFIARVKAVLRRCEQKSDRELQFHDLAVSVSRHLVLDCGVSVSLTKKEFQLLQYLLENQGIVLSRDQLLEHVWGYDFDGGTRTVDVHIRTLRQKLPHSSSLIETVRGVGYRIGGTPS